MVYEQKVLWSEGMFLIPHHFQQWDRYHDNLLHQRLRALQPLGFGVTEMDIDRDATGRGELVVSRLRGVLPDGTYIDVPTLDPIPESAAIRQWFKAEMKTLDVYIAVPRHRQGGRIYELSERIGPTLARYTASTVNLRDETTGEDERPVQTARKNVRVVFEGEPMEDLEKIQIARLVRTDTGGYALAEACVPPLLDVSASPYVIGILRGVLERLVNKSRSLFESRGQAVGGTATITAGDAGAFWMLHTVNGYVPPLQHFYDRANAARQNPSLGGVHPQVLYLEIARLIGELCTFRKDGTGPTETPKYDHDDLGRTFRELEAAVQSGLASSISTKSRTIPLEKRAVPLHGHHAFDATGLDDATLQEAVLYLSVASSAPHSVITQEFPTKARVTSTDRLEDVVRYFLDGLPIHYVPTPPDEVPRTVGRHLFALEKKEPEWVHIRESRTIGIGVPTEFEDLRVDLLAVSP
ncbi:MAG: type VI secretion system baseplate subunit TssK [Planctomycetota bacterium]